MTCCSCLVTENQCQYTVETLFHVFKQACVFKFPSADKLYVTQNLCDQSKLPFVTPCSAEGQTFPKKSTASGTLSKITRCLDVKGPHCAWSIRRDVRQGLCQLRCTSCRRSGPAISLDMPIYVFYEVPRIESSLLMSLKALLTCLWNGTEGFIFVKLSIFIYLFKSLFTVGKQNQPKLINSSKKI